MPSPLLESIRAAIGFVTFCSYALYAVFPSSRLARFAALALVPPSSLARSFFPISTYLPLGFTVLWSAIRSDLVKFRKVNVPKPFSRKFRTRNFPRSPTVYGFRRSIFTPGFARDCLRIVVRCNRFYRGSIQIVLTSEQLERFLKAAKEFGPREHAMFLFAVAHGARAQEICNLRISDVNFNNEQIHIARLKGSLPSTQTLLKVKGNSLFDEKAVLKAWLALRQPDADNFVFNSQKSTQMSRVTIFKLFRTIARKAELGETLQHPHVLKHTAAMLLVQQGANAFLIRQALGHKSFDSTLACVNPSDADASAAISKAFNQSC